MTFDHTASDNYELSSQNPELEYRSVLLVHRDDREEAQMQTAATFSWLQ